MRNFRGPQKQHGFVHKKIGKAIGGTIGTIGAAVIGAAGSYFGGKEQVKGSKEQAQAQMDFQERMSNTAHQREIIDLRMAGLNPILSATGGPGASSPGGAMAPIHDIITPAISSALQAARTRAELKIMQENVKNVKADTSLKTRQGALTSQQYNVSKKLEEKTHEETRNLKRTGERLHHINTGLRVEGQIDQTAFGKFFRYLNRLNPFGASAKGIIPK